MLASRVPEPSCSFGFRPPLGAGMLTHAAAKFMWAPDRRGSFAVAQGRALSAFRRVDCIMVRARLGALYAAPRFRSGSK